VLKQHRLNPHWGNVTKPTLKQADKPSLGKVGACPGEQQPVGDGSPATTWAGEAVGYQPTIPNAAGQLPTQ